MQTQARVRASEPHGEVQRSKLASLTRALPRASTGMPTRLVLTWMPPYSPARGYQRIKIDNFFVQTYVRYTEFSLLEQ